MTYVLLCRCVVEAKKYHICSFLCRLRCSTILNQLSMRKTSNYTHFKIIRWTCDTCHHVRSRTSDSVHPLPSMAEFLNSRLCNHASTFEDDSLQTNSADNRYVSLQGLERPKKMSRGTTLDPGCCKKTATYTKSSFLLLRILHASLRTYLKCAIPRLSRDVPLRKAASRQERQHLITIYPSADPANLTAISTSCWAKFAEFCKWIRPQREKTHLVDHRSVSPQYSGKHTKCTAVQHSIPPVCCIRPQNTKTLEFAFANST